jgi:hypothetical protein
MGFVDDLKSAVGFGGTTEVEPSWQTRLLSAKYTSPSGKVLDYEYGDVSVIGRNKTSVHDFADADGSYVQHKGASSRVFPLRMFFSGADYDTRANAFEEMLGERGVAKLDHPMYKTIDVVPVRDWRRTDRLVSAGNQAVFDVRFMRTIGIIYPDAQSDPQALTEEAIKAFNELSAAQFKAQMDIDSAMEEADFKDKFDALVKKASNVLGVIADKQADVKNRFDDIVDSINAGIDVLIADPLTLAFQTKIMLGAPARALTDIRKRLDGFKNLASDIFSGPDALASPVFDGPGSPGSPGFGPGNDSQSVNAYHVNNLFVTGAVVGQVLSSINNEFLTAPDAIEAAEAILELADETTAWQDENYESISGSTFSTESNIDTGEAYQKLQEAVALITGFLVDISFTLKQEKTITLDRPRALVELAGELYQDVGDETLNLLITSNRLTGTEILELPKGMDVVYYV